MKQKDKVFLTKQGKKELEEKLTYLKLEKREEIMQTLKEARALGDLSENSEYDSAREEQQMVEQEIRNIEYTLEHAEIIEDSSNSDEVLIGSKVQLQYDGENDIEEYRIVGSAEADPLNNKISNESPIASAILNKKAGSVVEVSSPDGIYKVKIVKVG